MKSVQIFLTFSAIGVVGFLVDGGVLQALVSLAGMSPYQARFVSFPIAVFVTWALNRRFTFASADGPSMSGWASFIRYLAFSLVGIAVNLAVYLSLLYAVDAFRALPIIPLAIASVAALFVNYFGAKHFSFRRP